MIHFFSEEIDFTLDKATGVGQWLLYILKVNKQKVEGVNFIFCSDSYLRALNERHLNHDYFTDILTFPYQSDPLLADIYISIDRVKENAKTFRTTFTDELHRVMVHGILHLIGFDDHTEEDKNFMRKQETLSLSLRDF
ncbi:rRNA maturation RNase YbeY [bacterium]|nr:rRNA maturation RNase YbeY [bacterium]